jgi:uncharacterized protein (DUF2062 family)
MRLLTIIKFILITLASTGIFLGLPLLVGQFTLQRDILLLSFMGGFFLSVVFGVYTISSLMKSTVVYANKKQRERAEAKHEST